MVLACDAERLDHHRRVATMPASLRLVGQIGILAVEDAELAVDLQLRLGRQIDVIGRPPLDLQIIADQRPRPLQGAAHVAHHLADFRDLARDLVQPDGNAREPGIVSSEAAAMVSSVACGFASSLMIYPFRSSAG